MCEINKKGRRELRDSDREEGRKPRKLRDTGREGKQNSILSCNQSLFGGSVTGSCSNVVRIERAGEENK